MQSLLTDHSTLEHSLTALATQRCDIILKAIADSAQELLRAVNMAHAIPLVLEQVGHATGVDRVHLLQIDPTAPVDDGHILDHCFWSAPNIVKPEEFSDGSGHTMVEVGLGSWVPRLAHGETIVGHVRDFEESVRRFFKIGHLKSTVPF